MPDYGTMIQKAYVAYFGRPADAVGYQYWLGGLNSNALTVEDMYMHFAASQEYLSNYAGMTDSQIVTAVYQNLFDRAPEADGLLYWSTQMSAGWITIDNVVIEILGGAQNSDAEVIANKVEASAAFTAALNTAAEINGYSGAEAAAEAKAWLADVTDDASLAAALAGLDAAIIDVITPDVPAPVNQTFILTTGQDDLTGGAGNDVFRSTQATLQLGDSVDGGAGQDKLTVSISGAGIALNGFAATSVETIEVKSLSTSASVIDLSDVDGLTTLVSRETDGAAMTFQDIQSVNNVDISIIDTKETHNFIYDVNAYTSGVDNVDLRLEEIRGAAINFGTVGGVLGKSGVEKITIDSQTLVSPDLGKNLVSDLNVGNSLDTVLINGNADLQVCAPLDPFITLVDATGLNARLSLDMSAEDINAGRVTFRGAQDDTYITFGSAANAKSITTYGGDDTILAGEGNNTIVSGAGNDYITAGAGNDNIDAGSGNDTVLAGEGNNTVSGGENDDSISTGSGNDVVFGGAGNDSLADLGGNNAIDMGAGDDTVKIGTATQCGCVENGMGNNLIDLGTGNDTLWMDAKELEVADTITGNAGSDTIVLCNVTGRVDYGYVMASETQRTTSIETFDLRNEGIYLTLTDNLIESAQDKTITVVTELSTGTQTVDITNITAPIYDFTLEGSRYKDIVVADDMTVNSMSTMRFDDPAYTTKENSTQDTLIVTDAANISATDTLNITGLEMIVLGGNTVWNVDITDALIRQTTGTSTLYIKVDDEVPEGSKLYLNTVGVITDSDTDVVVLRNSNVTVYLNGDLISVDGAALDYDTDNDGKGYLYFDTPLVFTHNADSLVGTDGDDIFYADTPEDINLSDYANGLSHDAGDKLILGAGVYSTASIWQQLNFSELDNIEILEFSEDVSYGVRFADAYTLDKYEFNTYYLTPGGDTVTNALSNHNFYMKGGADVLTTALGADNVYINGGLDNDVVNMLSSANNSAWIKIVDVERVNGDAGADRVDILDANTVPVYLDLNASTDNVNGSNNGDVITVYGDEGDDYVFGNNGADNIRAYDVESLSGGNGNDVINAREVMPENAPVDTVNGDAGDDVITVDNYDKILGGTGSDTITVKATQNNGTLWQNPDTIWGDEFNPTVVGGDDTIDVSGNIGEDVIVFGTEKGTNVHGATLFGNAAHPTGYDVSVTSGFDTILGFTTFATSGTDQDILNVRHLLDTDGPDAGSAADPLQVDTINFATIGNNFAGGSRNNVVIGFNAATDADGDVVLTASNFSAPGSLVTNTVILEDDGEAVLALTGDADGDNVDHLDLFYVCDTDLSVGQSWHIVKIGVVYFDGNGLTGLSGGSMENNFENSLVSL